MHLTRYISDLNNPNNPEYTIKPNNPNTPNNPEYTIHPNIPNTPNNPNNPSPGTHHTLHLVAPTHKQVTITTSSITTTNCYY